MFFDLTPEIEYIITCFTVLCKPTMTFATIIACCPDKANYVACWHDDVIKWKHFPRYWPFVWGNHRSPVVWCFLRLNTRLIKQSWGWWYETPSRPLWRYCNGCFKYLSRFKTICNVARLVQRTMETLFSDDAFLLDQDIILTGTRMRVRFFFPLKFNIISHVGA